MSTKYIEFVYELRTLCEKHGLVFGGGGSTETGCLKFGFRPKAPQDAEEHDYLHGGIIQVRQLHSDPLPEFTLAEALEPRKKTQLGGCPQ